MIRVNVRGFIVRNLAGNMSTRAHGGMPRGGALHGARRGVVCALIFVLALLQGLAPLLHAHAGRDVGPAGVHLYGLSALRGPNEAPVAAGLACGPAEPPAMVAKAGCRTDQAPALVPAGLAPVRFAAERSPIVTTRFARNAPPHPAPAFSTFLAQAPPAAA